jgi:ABC-2 type transport system ATP-binding protein
MIIKCEKVVKRYSGKLVLDEIELEVKQGEFFGLVGMNGSGKSTLIKSMLDLIGIDAGKIMIHGLSHRNVSSRDNITYLPDRFYPPAHLRGHDFIQYMLRLHGSEYDQQKIDSILDGLDLDKKVLRESVNKLSKGMTQKLGLASCLLSGKSVLVLDEPMSGLDPAGRRLFRDIILGLKDEGKTVVFASHVLPDVEALCDRVAMLVDGCIRKVGTVDELVNPVEGAFELVASGLPESLIQAWEGQGSLRRSGNRVIAMAPDHERVEGMVHEVFRSGGRLLAVRPFQATLEEALLAEIDGDAGQGKRGVA